MRSESPKSATTARKKRPKASSKKVAAPQRQSKALTPTGDFAALVERVVALIEEARSRVVRTVNSEMVLSNWHIGREIVEYVQRGEPRAEYGEEIIDDVATARVACRPGLLLDKPEVLQDLLPRVPKAAPRDSPHQKWRI